MPGIKSPFSELLPTERNLERREAYQVTMKSTSNLITGCLALGILLITASAVRSAGDTETGAPTRVMVGEYKWNYQKNPGPLRAEFTATGEDRWDVAFHFRFDGRDRTYLGTAEGDLSEGTVEGTVFNENRRRTFIFEARVEGGEFRGSHAETTSGGETRTGTLSLTEQRSGG